jgi:hypothetical protein
MTQHEHEVLFQKGALSAHHSSTCNDMIKCPCYQTHLDGQRRRAPGHNGQPLPGHKCLGISLCWHHLHSMCARCDAGWHLQQAQAHLHCDKSSTF